MVGILAFMTCVASATAAMPLTASRPRTRAQAAPPAESAAPRTDDATLSGSVAVIPFTNVSRDAADDWIGDGIAETVTADLESLGALTVIAQERVRAAAGRLSESEFGDIMETALGRALGARWIVTGGYQRLDSQLRITARLVDTFSGLVARTVKADGTLSDIFKLQDRIATELTTDVRSNTMARRGSHVGSRAGAGVGLSASGEGTETVVAGDGSTGGSSGTSATGGARFGEVSGGIILPDGDTPNLSGGGGLGAAGRGGPANRAPRGGRGGRPGEVGTAESAGVLTGRPSVTAVRSEQPPRIDGQLDDAIWQRAIRLTEFVQVRPVDGAPASEDTEVWIAYDSSNLYMAMHAHYTDPGIARANRVDRDQMRSDDTISVYFDTFLDQQRAYVFAVNGYGVQGDSLLTSRGGGGPGGGGGGFRGGGSAFGGGVPSGDSSWDALFDSAGTLVSDGWTAELSIPFKSLRYPSNDDHRWGFQVVRLIGGKDETVVWSPMTRGNTFMSQMGLVDGLSGLSTSRNLEMLPTFTAVHVGSLDTNTGGFSDVRQPEGALNVKYGLTSNLTFDFTYNPDFSQIESDQPQIEVNQRFPLFFPELRPFFLEGQEIFQTRGPANLLHTRTIVDPRYGAKVTGKVGNATIGLLFANDEAAGKVDDRADPAFGKTAQFLVARARYDLYAESYVGAIVTDREFLDQYSRVGGVDARFRLGRSQSVSLSFIQSQHRDADGVERTGPGWSFNYDNQGRNLSYAFSTDGLDPDFRTDTGFVRRVDTRRARANVSYRWYPESWIISWGPQANYSRNYDFAGILQDEGTRIGLNASFVKNIDLNFNVNRDMERFAGINFFKTRYSAGGVVTSSRRISFGGFVNWGDQIRFSETPFLGTGSSANLYMGLRPNSRFRSEWSLSTSRLVDPSTMQDVFDVKIFRALSTYQFTERLLLRNIMEFNTFDRTLGANLLLTYRVNFGTVFFVGYDDRYQQGDLIFDDDADPLFYTTDFERTNRAFFMKISYLFRY